MNIQLEINGEPHTGSAIPGGAGILIHLPGVQIPSAQPFETLFRGMPEDNIRPGPPEAGARNGKENTFAARVVCCGGPDGQVWAQVRNSLYQAMQILGEAEEAFNAISTAREWAASLEWPLPVTIEDYLFWLEFEAARQEDALNRSPEAPGIDLPYVRALRGVANELRQLGFTPAPWPWSSKTGTPSTAG